MSLYNDASLVMIPSAYKDGKLYSIKPTDGSGDFTFSRGSNLAATRVDENGLIEKGRENLLLQSNTFSSWSIVNATTIGGQSGYDGSSDAWLLSATNNYANVYRTISKTDLLTFSCYAKAGTSDWMMLRLNGSSNNLIYFDVANGVLGTIVSSNYIDSNIEALANGWFRLSITINQTSYSGCNIYVAAADNDLITTNETIYIQDAQLEQGLVATDYIETTTTTAQAGILEDMPRLDYSGGASCPSLLLEPQRTNLVTQSEYAGGYTTSGAGTVIDNADTSPEGVDNAFELNDTSSGAYFRIEDTISLSSSDHTFSVFVKKTSGALSHYAGLQLDSSRSYVIVDTTNGTYNEYTGTPNDSVTIEDFSDDWWRVIITNSITAGSIRIAIWPAISSNGTSIDVAATGANTFYGIQLEAGSYPTSYIPCYGAATSRSADVCNKTGISSLIGQEQGTILVDVDFETLSGINMFVSIRPDASNKIEIYRSDAIIYGEFASSVSFNFSASSVTVGRYKIAVAYSSGSSAMYINGVLVGSNTTPFAFTSTLDDIYINSRNGSSYIEQTKYKQAAIFPTRLTDAELAALTTI